MDKMYVLTFIKVVNGSLKKVETSIANDFQVLGDKMFADYAVLYDVHKQAKGTKITYNTMSSNIEMYVNTPDDLIHFSWNISTNKPLK
jgi:hypothetical protein